MHGLHDSSSITSAGGKGGGEEILDIVLEVVELEEVSDCPHTCTTSNPHSRYMGFLVSRHK